MERYAKRAGGTTENIFEPMWLKADAILWDPGRGGEGRGGEERKRERRAGSSEEGSEQIPGKGPPRAPGRGKHRIWRAKTLGEELSFSPSIFSLLLSTNIYGIFVDSVWDSGVRVRTS